MATNEDLKTHCYYTMENKRTGEQINVTVSYPFTADRAREKCTVNKKVQKDWKVVCKSFY